MTSTGLTLMAKNHHARPRERLSAYLAQRYPGVGRDKRLAADLRTSPRAARNLFEGHWPGDETWAAIVRRFGQDVLRVVFAPEIDPVLAEIREREARLARELEGLRARRREVEGLGEPGAFVLAAGPDQAPAEAVGPDLFATTDTIPPDA
jgi:hypothetical protein